MAYVRQTLNDIYQGVYLYSRKYEIEETAKKGTDLRMIGLIFLYYFGTLALILKVYVQFYGRFTLSPIGAIVLVFGGYFVVYKYLINPLLVKDNFDNEFYLSNKKQLIQKGKFAFLYAIFYLVFCLFLINVIVTYIQMLFK